MVEDARVKKQWSDKEKIALGILLSILTISLVLFGLILYEPPTGPGLCGAFGAEPCPGREALEILTWTLNSPTNMTLRFFNAGSVAENLVSYYVKNSNSQTYTNSNWSGPTIPPNAAVDLNIIIDGSVFTFQAYNSYTVTVITSRNTQFTFNIQT